MFQGTIHHLDATNMFQFVYLQHMLQTKVFCQKKILKRKRKKQNKKEAADWYNENYIKR